MDKSVRMEELQRVHMVNVNVNAQKAGLVIIVKHRFLAQQVTKFAKMVEMSMV
jgi:hypothetical protein